MGNVETGRGEFYRNNILTMTRKRLLKFCPRNYMSCHRNSALLIYNLFHILLIEKMFFSIIFCSRGFFNEAQLLPFN